MVEATTKEVKIPVPGTPGSYVVCKVSILALGGGCGVLTNGADWNGPQDDPDTSTRKRSASARPGGSRSRGQDAGRLARDEKLYEQACRKPLVRRPRAEPGGVELSGRGRSGRGSAGFSEPK